MATAMSVPWCGTVGVLPVASGVRIASRQHLIAIPEAALVNVYARGLPVLRRKGKRAAPSSPLFRHRCHMPAFPTVCQLKTSGLSIL